jgi:hypothetical protein
MPVCLHILPGYRTLVKDPWNGTNKEGDRRKESVVEEISSVTGFIAATGISPFP